MLTLLVIIMIVVVLIAIHEYITLPQDYWTYIMIIVALGLLIVLGINNMVMMPDFYNVIHWM